MPASDGRATGDVDESLRLLSLVERTLTGRLEEALRRCGSSLDQWRILRLLADRGGCPMNVVADHVLLLAPKLSKLVDRMVAANLVLRRRDHEDRRRVLIVVSTRGLRALAEWDEAVADVRGRFRELLGTDAEQFETVLRRLRDGVAPAGTPGLEPSDAVLG
ncbi:MarR family winged helix-turn-helix transcriptional regulator [Actinomycetospora cinnamomea]|uniref:DNA-binding MarR family transcriptional regulator n=1 Tax=Actinomycetospora cinnamomea TaxID=663609 RepID=A0A2U1EZK8_9PSEU|nr:MarR family winged helix-turn-helix transcriptional regulator [Actinomycetospora cinnamomea]PVZ05358.1 DNA-binding MarR family transcriptional regulator [Actinomycetospora cinnamomea]